MNFYIIAALVGAIGTLCDVYISKWANKLTLGSWSIAGVLILCFMTSLGYCMKIGIEKGYSISTIAIIAAIMNTLGIVAWDTVSNGTPLASPKILGVLFAIIAIVLLNKK